MAVCLQASCFRTIVDNYDTIRVDPLFKQAMREHEDFFDSVLQMVTVKRPGVAPPDSAKRQRRGSAGGASDPDEEEGGEDDEDDEDEGEEEEDEGEEEEDDED